MIQQAAAARGCLSGEVSALRRRCDIPARIRGSLKTHPVTWLAASLVTGVATRFAIRRKPQCVKKPRSLPSVLFGLTLTAARPMVKIWLAKQANLWLARLANPAPASNPDSRLSPPSKFR